MKNLHAEHHVQPVSLYVKNFAALAAFMVLTIFVAEHPTGSTFANNAIALVIASIKASLVIAIFMGVWFSTKLTKFWAMLGFFWFTLMFITFCDYATRRLEEVKGWEPSQAEGMPRGPAPKPGEQPIRDRTDNTITFPR